MFISFIFRRVYFPVGQGVTAWNPGLNYNNMHEYTQVIPNVNVIKCCELFLINACIIINSLITAARQLNENKKFRKPQSTHTNARLMVADVAVRKVCRCMYWWALKWINSHVDEREIISIESILSNVLLN